MDNSNNILYLNKNYGTDFRKVSRICRACMAAKQKMLNINHFKGSFKDLLGIDISPSDGLPQWLCIECSSLLKKCIKFRHLVMQSHNTLSQCVLKTVLISDRESYVDIEAAPHLPLAKESSSHEQSSRPDPTKSENITQKKDSGNATSRLVKKNGSAKAKIKKTKIKTKKVTVIRKSDTQNGIHANGEQIEVQNNVVVVLLKNKNNKDTNVKSTIVTGGGVVNNSSSNIKPYRFDESKNCLNNINSFPACVSENSIERSFKCDSCEKCFTTKYYSSLHAQIHAGGGPFKCDLCYKCYVFKCSLEQHIRKHRVRMPNMRYHFCSRP